MENFIMVDVVYIPTADHIDEEIEEMYDNIGEMLNLGKVITT